MMWLGLSCLLYAAILLGSWIGKQSKLEAYVPTEEKKRTWTAGWDAIRGCPYLILSTDYDHMGTDPQMKFAKEALERNKPGEVECRGRDPHQ